MSLRPSPEVFSKALPVVIDVRNAQADVLALALRASKLWNKIIMQRTVIPTKLCSKSLQIKQHVMMAVITMRSYLISVRQTLAKRSVGAERSHADLLSGDSYYTVNETETNHISPYSRRAI